MNTSEKFMIPCSIDEANHSLPDLDLTEPLLSDITVTEQDVIDQIKSLNCAKSCGPDGVTPKLLFEASNTVVPSLTKLFHLSLSKCTFPQ